MVFFQRLSVVELLFYSFQISLYDSGRYNRCLRLGMFTMFKYISNKIAAVGVSSCLTLIVPTVAFAAYMPPSDQVPPRTRGSTAGRRAPCSTPNSNEIQERSGMIALAPVSYMGKTASTHPTFAWFAYDTVPIPVQFSVYEYDAARNNFNPQPLVQEKLVNSAGINSYKLPKTSQGLSKGKTYAWQVVLTCDVQSNSRNRWIRNPIQLIEMSTQLKQKLSVVNTPSQKLNLYAEAGLWYDALDVALKHDQNPRLRSAMLALISGLAQVEKAREPKELPKDVSISYSLEQIVASEARSAITPR